MRSAPATARSRLRSRWKVRARPEKAAAPPRPKTQNRRNLAREGRSSSVPLPRRGTEKEQYPKEDAVKNFFDLNFQKRWVTFSIYEKFEHLIISLLTAIIAALVGAATWQLILHTFALVRSHVLDPRDSQVFQTVFGMVLTVLIAMEFKHSLLIVLPHQRDIVQIRSVVLIALLALVRKFIILDIYQTQPAVVFALAAASRSLGIVLWLVRNQDEPEAPLGPTGETKENAETTSRTIPVNAINAINAVQEHWNGRQTA